MAVAIATTAIAALVAREDPSAAADVVDVKPRYEFDLGNDRAPAGYAFDIFAGGGVAQTGSQGAWISMPGQTMPRAQFSVEVFQTVKGSTSGSSRSTRSAASTRQPAAWSSSTGTLS